MGSANSSQERYTPSSKSELLGMPTKTRPCLLIFLFQITHHHHDHNYGASDFVAAGATLVCPERYKYYWESIPGVKFALVT